MEIMKNIKNFAQNILGCGCPDDQNFIIDNLSQVVDLGINKIHLHVISNEELARNGL